MVIIDSGDQPMAGNDDQYGRSAKEIDVSIALVRRSRGHFFGSCPEAHCSFPGPED